MKGKHKIKLPLITRLTGFHKGMDTDKLYAYYQTPESAVLDVEGMPLHYRVTGDGPPLLLMHGVTSSLHTWSGWHKELSNHFRVISFDVPSFGMTGPHPANDYSLAMYMRTIDTLLAHLQVGNVMVAGNSFGGYLTWNYALHQPRKVQKIILINAAGISAHAKDLKSASFKLFLNPLTKKIAHLITPRNVLRQNLMAVYGDKTKVTEELIDLYHHLLLNKGNREGFSEVLGKTILHGGDNHPKIRQVQQPAFVMWGDKDKLIRPKDAHAFGELLPKSQVKIYKGVGHVPMEEIPEITAADALEFLLD